MAFCAVGLVRGRSGGERWRHIQPQGIHGSTPKLLHLKSLRNSSETGWDPELWENRAYPGGLA